MLAQRLQDHFIRTFVAAGLNQFGDVAFSGCVQFGAGQRNGAVLLAPGDPKLIARFGVKPSRRR